MCAEDGWMKEIKSRAKDILLNYPPLYNKLSPLKCLQTIIAPGGGV